MLFTLEQNLIRETARDFAAHKIAPYAGAWETKGLNRKALLSELGRLGLMGIFVPTEWDGAGADFVSYVLATEEIAGADSGICNMMNVHNSPVCAALSGYGTESQKRRYLQPLARGELFGAFLLTEPEAGSDAGALKTRAVRNGDRYVINSVKQFITSGRTADIAMILAVTNPEAGRKASPALLLRPTILGTSSCGRRKSWDTETATRARSCCRIWKSRPPTCWALSKAATKSHSLT